MHSPIKLFVCEFITGGGLHHAPLPKSLAAEGLLMREALLRDLSVLTDYDIVTTHDYRINPSEYVSHSLEVDHDKDVWLVWESYVQTADCVWLIAPETQQVLKRLTEMANRYEKPVIGSGIEAIEIATSKFRTHQHLSAAQINTIPTWFYSEWLIARNLYPTQQRWLVKPDDGAGCDETYIFEHAQALSHWYGENVDRSSSHVVQPFCDGVPASISVVGDGNQCLLLSCNLQQIKCVKEQLYYAGGVVNGALDFMSEMSVLAKQVQQALPDLKGYFGLDVLLPAHPNAPLTLLEINPRLTTTYAKLAEAMECNPAELILNVLFNPTMPIPAFKMNQIEFKVAYDA
jgi:tyramine---L-glutamate ligase